MRQFHFKSAGGSAKLGVQCDYGGSIDERDAAFKKERSEGATSFYILLVSRQVPVSQEYWRKRIGPSLADRSRVELALLLLPAVSAASKVHIMI